MKILDEIKDPETGESISKMIEKIEKENNKIKIKLKIFPLCPFLGLILTEIEEKLKEKGYEVEIEI